MSLIALSPKDQHCYDMGKKGGGEGGGVKEVQQELSGRGSSHPCALTLNIMPCSYIALNLQCNAVLRRVVSFSRYALCSLQFALLPRVALRE